MVASDLRMVEKPSVQSCVVHLTVQTPRPREVWNRHPRDTAAA